MPEGIPRSLKKRESQEVPGDMKNVLGSLMLMGVIEIYRGFAGDPRGVSWESRGFIWVPEAIRQGPGDVTGASGDSRGISGASEVIQGISGAFCMYYQTSPYKI